MYNIFKNFITLLILLFLYVLFILIKYVSKGGQNKFFEKCASEHNFKALKRWLQNFKLKSFSFLIFSLFHFLIMSYELINLHLCQIINKNITFCTHIINVQYSKSYCGKIRKRGSVLNRYQIMCINWNQHSKS